MELQTFTYQEGQGWSLKSFPALDSIQTLVLIFAAPQFSQNPAPLLEIAKHYPNSKIVGCSSAGEISGSHILDGSISVAVAKFSHTPLEIVETKIHAMTDSLKVGKTIAERLNKPDLRSIFVLSDGLNVNGSELVKGLNDNKNEDVIITGGLAGDGSRFKETWIIYKGEIVKNTVIAVGFYGDHIQIGHGSRGGWDIFGPERLITESKNNILYRLDDRPALELYKEYLGERANGLPATGLLYPLAIRKDANDTNQLVRTILAVNEKDQSLTFAGDVPTGHLARLMRANLDRLITAADEAGDLAFHRMTKLQDKAHPLLAIAVSCVGRRLLLGERTEEETESTLESLPDNALQVGFYSYGEISPYTTGACVFHNQTMTLTTLAED